MTVEIKKGQRTVDFRGWPSPLKSSGDKHVLPVGELGAGKNTVCVAVIGVDVGKGVGEDEGANSQLELFEVKRAGVIQVENVPVLSAEVVKEVLAGLVHLDGAGDLGSAGDELGIVNETIDTAAEEEEALVDGGIERVDDSGEPLGEV